MCVCLRVCGFHYFFSWQKAVKGYFVTYKDTEKTLAISHRFHNVDSYKLYSTDMSRCFGVRKLFMGRQDILKFKYM